MRSNISVVILALAVSMGWAAQEAHTDPYLISGCGGSRASTSMWYILDTGDTSAAIHAS
jgi:hypothetical protein